jgi:hypothetical protein
MRRMGGCVVSAMSGLVVLAGCGAGHGAGGPLMYRGESGGVEMMLEVSTIESSAPLTLHFGPGSQAVRRRVLRTRHLQLSCFWPSGPLSNLSQGIDVKLNPLKRTQVIPGSVGNERSSGGYSCALSAAAPNLPEWPATRFLRHAIVAVHLSRSTH